MGGRRVGGAEQHLRLGLYYLLVFVSVSAVVAMVALCLVVCRCLTLLLFLVRTLVDEGR